jgi:small subunit ribosomal protein S17
MDKTIMVEVQTLRRHPRYERVVRRRKRFMAHDEENTCSVGDLVRIEESRPLSRRKRWRLIAVLTRAGERRSAGKPAAAVVAPSSAAEPAAAEPVAETTADELETQA